MEGMKNKAAQELSRKRWEKTDQQNFRAFQKLDGARRIERNEMADHSIQTDVHAGK